MNIVCTVTLLGFCCYHRKNWREVRVGMLYTMHRLPTGNISGSIKEGINQKTRTMATNNNIQPLTPAVFHILLALSSGERHGYGIMKQVEADSQGKVNMGAGTLYGSLKRMLDAGLVKESDKRVDPEMDDERRIYYQITGAGAKSLAAELKRYQDLVKLAQKRKLYPKILAYDV